MSIKNFLYLLPIALLTLFIAHAAADDDYPPVFQYQFPETAPLKIYSGPVTFEHKKHFDAYKIECARCHHDLEPGETEVDENCRDCHAEEGFPRFAEAADLGEDEKIEHYLVALHTLCVDCHIDTRLKDKKTGPPISCTRCHLRR